MPDIMTPKPSVLQDVQPCPRCQEPVAPRQSKVEIYGLYVNYTHPLQSTKTTESFLAVGYHCNCGWVWSTPPQRERNSHSYNSAYRRLYPR